MKVFALSQPDRRVALLRIRTEPIRGSTAGDGTPTGIAVAIGAVVIVAAAMVAAFVPSSDAAARFAVIAFGLASFALASSDWMAAAAVVPLAWLVYNGFIQDRFGVLVWHGWSDLGRLGLLVAAAAIGLGIGAWRRDDAKRASLTATGVRRG